MMQGRSIKLCISWIIGLVFFSVIGYAQINVEKELWHSAKTGTVVSIDYFKGVNANIINDDGQTPLMLAVQNGHIDVVQAFSEAVVNVQEEDYNGKTAFDYIPPFATKEEQMYSRRMYGALRVLEVYQIVRGQVDIAQYAYDNKTDILEITIKGVGADCENYLLPNNTKCQAIRLEANRHPIFQSIKDHNNTMFDSLLAEVDLTVKDTRNYPMLWRAILYKNYYVVDQLLQKGVDITMHDPNNLHTPIRWAVIQNDVDLLSVLLKHGVDVNSKDKFGNYALFQAMYKCRSFETVALLLDNGANPYLKNKRGKTVFDQEPSFCKKPSDIQKMKELLKERSAF